jgi:DNA repair protein RadD
MSTTLEVGQWKLFPHQQDSISDLRVAMGRGRKHIILQSPCGSGKTIVAAAIIYLARAKSMKVLCIADSRQLVYQLSEKLTLAEIPHSTLMAGEEYSYSDITICTKQTLFSRCYQRESVPKPAADLVIVDEAHKSTASDYQVILKDYRNAHHVGLTATPEESGGFWEEIIVGGTYDGLTPEFLVPCRVYMPWEVDMRGAATSGRDWTKGAVEERHNTTNLVGDVFSNWKRIAGDKRTVVFASGVSHSLHLCSVFNKHGVNAEHVDAETPQKSTSSRKGREEIFSGLRDGDVQVICNVGVCRVGWDAPWVECGVLAFSTKSLVQYVQTTGRLFRKFEGKEHGTVIDHGGNVARFGWPTEDHEYELKPRVTVEKRIRDKQESQESRESHCPNCSYVWLDGRRGDCPMCGHHHVRIGWPETVVGADLKEVVRKKSWRGEEQKVWDKCLGIAANTGGRPATARALYHQYTGSWPQGSLYNYIGHGMGRGDVDRIMSKYRRGRKRA